MVALLKPVETERDGYRWPSGSWQRLAGTAEGAAVIAAALQRQGPVSLAEARRLLGAAARAEARGTGR